MKVYKYILLVVGVVGLSASIYGMNSSDNLDIFGQFGAPAQMPEDDFAGMVEISQCIHDGGESYPSVPAKMTVDDTHEDHCDRKLLFPVCDERGWWICTYPKCGMSFATKKNLTLHWLIHRRLLDDHKKSSRRTYVSERLFGCTVCDKIFKRLSDLKRHECTHSAEKAFMCATCGKTFAREYSLDRHERLHVGRGLSVCNICKRFFRTPSGLVRHLKCEKHVQMGSAVEATESAFASVADELDDDCVL